MHKNNTSKEIQDIRRASFSNMTPNKVKHNLKHFFHSPCSSVLITKLNNMEWDCLVSPSQADGKHCKHNVFFLTFIIDWSIEFQSTSAYPCKIFLSSRTNYNAVNWALVNAQRNAARKWLPLLGNSWTDRTLPCCRLITMISLSSWHTSIPCFSIQWY